MPNWATGTHSMKRYSDGLNVAEPLLNTLICCFQHWKWRDTWNRRMWEAKTGVVHEASTTTALSLQTNQASHYIAFSRFCGRLAFGNGPKDWLANQPVLDGKWSYTGHICTQAQRLACHHMVLLCPNCQNTFKGRCSGANMFQISRQAQNRGLRKKKWKKEPSPPRSTTCRQIKYQPTPAVAHQTSRVHVPVLCCSILCANARACA